MSASSSRRQSASARSRSTAAAYAGLFTSSSLAAALPAAAAVGMFGSMSLVIPPAGPAGRLSPPVPTLWHYRIRG